MKRVTLFVAALAMIVAAPAFAEVPMAERGIVQEEMTGEVGFAFQLDMSKGLSIGDVMHMPIWVEYSFLDNLELGFMFPLQLKPSGNTYTGFDFWGVYRFLKDEKMELGAGLVVHFPKDNIGKMLGFSILVPFKYQFSQEFSLLAALDLNLGVIDMIFDPATITLGADVVYNIMPELYVFGGLDFVLPTKNTGNAMTIPMNVGLGYTIIEMIDVGVKFDADLYKKSAVFYRRVLGIFAALSF